MESGLNTILFLSLILVTGSITIFFIFLIQILVIIRRLLTKIELRIDNFELTQEEIKLKILKFIEEILHKIKKNKFSNPIGKAGDDKDEKKDKK